MLVDLVKARAAARNRLRAHLQLAYPGVVGLFAELDGKTSLAFLTRFRTPRHARWLSEKRLATWLRSVDYTRLSTAPRLSCSSTCAAPGGAAQEPGGRGRRGRHRPVHPRV